MGLQCEQSATLVTLQAKAEPGQLWCVHQRRCTKVTLQGHYRDTILSKIDRVPLPPPLNNGCVPPIQQYIKDGSRSMSKGTTSEVVVPANGTVLRQQQVPC